MKKLSMYSISLAAFSGVAVLMLVTSLTAPVNAAVGNSSFRATPEELRRHCWRIDETFWMSKRRYGCGEIFCAVGKCRTTFVPPPPDYPTPGVYAKDGGGDGKGGGRGAGGATGGQQSGSAGGPN